MNKNKKNLLDSETNVAYDTIKSIFAMVSDISTK